MTLIELKQHLERVKIASLRGLCALFKTDDAIMQTMLDFLIRKGCLKRTESGKSCQNACTRCGLCELPRATGSSMQNAYYEYMG